ncbi:MAG: 4-hydroxythreonine-4-phosphate dehydrogenase PdxA [Nitrospinaceae bacterium]
MEASPRIAVTMGDPAGIGPEMIVRGLAAGVSGVRPLVVGDVRRLREAASRLAPSLILHPVTRAGDARWEPGRAEVFNLENVPADLPYGQPSLEGGQAAVDYIRTAVDLALAQDVDAITTGPISKEALHLAGHFYPGHTELLADLTGAPHSRLMLAAGDFRVVLVTTHVSLAEVPSRITLDRILTTLRLTHDWLVQHGTADPHLAVTGLNPHCGDGGIFGREEEQVIIPALDRARREGLRVEGPLSADALFGRRQQMGHDAIVAMYHDQGMIPIKMAAPGRAVNITLGLPIIRTSVDHGTAYDIAGQGLARTESFLEALRLTAALAQTAAASR